MVYPEVLRSTRRKLPMGIGQIGKAFRNEISPSHSVFRAREFEQAELEYFCLPEEGATAHDYWVRYCQEWLRLECGLGAEEEEEGGGVEGRPKGGEESARLRVKRIAEAEAAHYAQSCVDLEYRFPFGWGELWGIGKVPASPPLCLPSLRQSTVFCCSLWVDVRIYTL